jgi:hypothetical protein
MFGLLLKFIFGIFTFSLGIALDNQSVEADEQALRLHFRFNQVSLKLSYAGRRLC